MLVTLAAWLPSPIASSDGKVSRVPPPAMELTIPANHAAANAKANGINSSVAMDLLSSRVSVHCNMLNETRRGMTPPCVDCGAVLIG